LNSLDEQTIISTNTIGVVNLIALPPSPSKFEKIFTFTHGDPEGVSSQIGIISAVYSSSLKKLFVID
jgi:hypothetical protein